MEDTLFLMDIFRGKSLWEKIPCPIAALFARRASSFENFVEIFDRTNCTHVTACSVSVPATGSEGFLLPVEVEKPKRAWDDFLQFCCYPKGSRPVLYTHFIRASGTDASDFASKDELRQMLCTRLQRIRMALLAFASLQSRRPGVVCQYQLPDGSYLTPEDVPVAMQAITSNAAPLAIA